MVGLKLILLNTLTILGSLILITGGPWIFQWLGSSELLGTLINGFAVLVMVLISFGITFKVAPAEPQKFNLISPGAVVGAVLFVVAGYGFRLWVSHVAHYEILYGALGSFMMILVWSFLMSVVFLMATEMNKLAKYASELDEGNKEIDEC
jgi:membrane protein